MNHPQQVRVALVGAGYVSAHHLRALRSLDHVQIVGIADLDLDRAARVARQYGIPCAVRTLAELRALAPNAIHVLTPPPSHCPLTLEALDMGCHVLVEKPMATSVEECDRMIAKARSAGRILSVNHSARLDPVIQKALRIVAQGKLGDILAVDFFRSSDYPPYSGGPLPIHHRGGGYPFRDIGVHGLCLMEAFLGPIRDLEARYRSSGRDPNLVFDEWRALVDCEKGVGQLQLSWNVQPLQNELLVQGTRGVMRIDCFLQTCTVRRRLPVPKTVQRMVDAAFGALLPPVMTSWNALRLASGAIVPAPGIHESVRLFHTALAEGAEPPVSPEEGRRLVDWIERAARQADREKTRRLSAPSPQPRATTLLTGATGFLGRALLERLLEAGEQVRVLVRRQPAGRLFSHPRVELAYGDLGDPEAVDRAVQGIKLIYHVGAATSGSWPDYQRGTVCGTRNVVSACTRHRVQRLVYVSSLSVLDYHAVSCAQPVDESAAVEPRPECRGHYTLSKTQAERIVRDAIRDHNLPAVILRPGQIFGPSDAHPSIYGTVTLGNRCIVVGDGSCRLPLIYLDDVVDAILLAADRPGACGSIFHVVDPEPITQNEFLSHARSAAVRAPRMLLYAAALAAELAGKLLRRSVPVTRYRLGTIRSVPHFDCSAAERALGWRPRVGVRGGLLRTFAPAHSGVVEEPVLDATPQ